MQYPSENWHSLDLPDMDSLPRPVFFRANTIPEKTLYPAHTHAWHQLVYASNGVLTVDIGPQSFVITPEQAIWIPAHQDHASRSYSGAMFRSLYIEDSAHPCLEGFSEHSKVILVSPLLKELITKAAAFDVYYREDSFEGRIIDILLEEMVHMPEAGLPLPWPHSPHLQKICEALHQDPADNRSLEQWGQELGTSSRTLIRHFENETGLSQREWRRRLRLIKALEYLGEGDSVTRASLRLGYRSTSAFIHAFKEEYGTPPLQFLKENGIRL